MQITDKEVKELSANKVGKLSCKFSFAHKTVLDEHKSVHDYVVAKTFSVFEHHILTRYSL